MTLQPGQQRITINILVNILRIKDNQTMKLGQLIEHNKRNIFLQKSCRKLGRETSSRPLFNFFYKTFMLGKSTWSATQFHYVSQPSNQHTIKTNCLKFYTYDPEICSILIFQIRVWEKFLHHILHMNFQQKQPHVVF